MAVKHNYFCYIGIFACITIFLCVATSLYFFGSKYASPNERLCNITNVTYEEICRRDLPPYLCVTIILQLDGVKSIYTKCGVERVTYNQTIICYKAPIFRPRLEKDGFFDISTVLFTYAALLTIAIILFGAIIPIVHCCIKQHSKDNNDNNDNTYLPL
jgi:hypothetical protein